MSWNRKRITGVASASAPCDYLAFEAIGLSEIENASVLDMGSFDGFNTRLKFAPYSNIVRIVGVDPMPDMVRAAQEDTTDERFSWEVGNAEDYAGESNSFDLVYFSHVFQHTKDKDAVLQNVYRLLKPGGYVVIKTVDDSCNISCPDPINTMRRLYKLYEEYVVHNTPHTAYTDRNNGSKCYSLLQHAGFTSISVSEIPTSTAGKTKEERLGLFERGTYFRKNVPACVPPAIADEIHELLAEWEGLFRQDDYFYATQTFVVTGQKPYNSNSASDSCCESKPTLKSGYNASQTCLEGCCHLQLASIDDYLATLSDSKIALSVMEEAHLGQVMGIEIQSFPDPWTPVAYAMELRYNTRAFYLAANAEGRIAGYIGCWIGNGQATIANIAVDPTCRRLGIGRTLLHAAFVLAAKADCSIMQLQVRKANTTARSFYASNGFSEDSISKDYYTNPDDDAVILVRSLDDFV